MAKTKGPLLSQDAHGSLSKLLTYSRRKSGSQVRKYNKPLVIASAKQRAHRRLNEFATIQWLCMSDATKDTWKAAALASGLNLPGYQYFLREALRDPYNVMDLVGYWSMNEIVAGQVQDFSGNNLHGTLEPDYPTTAPILAAGMTSKFHKCLDFIGSTPMVKIGEEPKTRLTGNLSWECWVYAYEWVFFQSPQFFGCGSTNYIFYCPFGIALQVSLLGLTFTKTGDKRIKSASIPNALQWFHLSFSWDGTTGKIFVNGEIYEEDTASGTIDIPTGQFQLGSRFVGCNTRFLIDESCVYRRALSDAEFKKRYLYGLR